MHFSGPLAPNESEQAQFSEALDPATHIEMKYSMHVSKFRNTVTIDDMTAHIMNNTSIVNNEESFEVEKLGKPGFSFCSFKVSAATMAIYDEIKSVWAPLYTAREFIDNRNRNNNKNNNNGGNRRFGAGNETQYRTPRNGTNRNRNSSGFGNYPNTPRVSHRSGRANSSRDDNKFPRTPSQNRYNRQNNRREENVRNDNEEPRENSNVQNHQKLKEQQTPPIIYVLPQLQQPSMQTVPMIPPNFLGSQFIPLPMPKQYMMPMQPQQAQQQHIQHTFQQQ